MALKQLGFVQTVLFILALRAAIYVREVVVRQNWPAGDVVRWMAFCNACDSSSARIVPLLAHVVVILYTE